MHKELKAASAAEGNALGSKNNGGSRGLYSLDRTP
jgi:hypothetical protein